MKTDVDSVLTSGGAETAFDGKEIINEMVRISNGKIKIITAGKVALTDLQALQNVINAQEFHGIKIVGDLSD
jgi:copper homeostasis protein